jgi:transposase-like protein
MSEANSRRPRRTFTPEFKADAVRLATAPGTSIAQTARDLGLADSLLRSWIKEVRQPSSGLTQDERSELAALRRENRRLKEEREILKKAAAFFAKEQR